MTRALAMGARASPRAHCAGHVLTWHGVGGAYRYVQRDLQRDHHPLRAHRRGPTKTNKLMYDDLVKIKTPPV